MLVELKGKGGGLCQLAREGKLHCPLIVRPSSEDVITDHLFRTLRVLNPRWWLPDLLNEALGASRFRRQVFRQFRIELWQKQRQYPRHWLQWDEGKTEVDAVITWENPPTTVFIEMKYGSGLSQRTVHNNGQNGYAGDQLIRNIRVGLMECGCFEEPKLFTTAPRDFVQLLISPLAKHPLVEQYRDVGKLRAAIPSNEHLTQLPCTPFVGAASFQQVSTILQSQRNWFSRPEGLMIDDLTDYLAFKRTQLR